MGVPYAHYSSNSFKLCSPDHVTLLLDTSAQPSGTTRSLAALIAVCNDARDHSCGIMYVRIGLRLPCSQ